MLYGSEIQLKINNGSNKNRMFAKRPTLIADSSFAHLDLHVQVPPVLQLNWAVADKFINIAATHADETTWSTMTAAYRDVSAAKTIYDNQLVKGSETPEASLFGNDLHMLISSGFASDTGLKKDEFEKQTKQFCYVRLFSVVETRNDVTRRRVIAWPKTLNEAEHLVEERLRIQHVRGRFYTAHEVRDEGMRKHFAASLDFKKFFQQFTLHTKEYFCFHFRDRVYQLATIPTGAVFPPLFAQALSRTLLALAVRRANVASHVTHDCCIDNLRLMSDNLHALRAAWHELLSACAALGATIGEMTPPPGDAPVPYTYLGMKFSVVDSVSRVELADKSKKKVALAIKTLQDRNALIVADVLAIFGQTVWASTVTDFKLGRIYYAIKFIRRIQSQPLNSYVVVWPSIVDTWCEALRAISAMSMIQAAKQTRKATMFTDASEDGWGVVILNFDLRPIRVFGGKWSKDEALESINLLELRAIRIGLRILAKLKNVADVIGLSLYVDNTTARSWAKRARARRWTANELALQIADESAKEKIQLESIEYVRSYQNLADKPSRRL